MVKQKRAIDWHLWANEMVFWGAVGHMAMSCVTIYWGVFAPNLNHYGWGIAGIVFGFLIAFFEYPRGNRMNGRKPGSLRLGQQYVSKVIRPVNKVTGNFLYRTILYAALVSPNIWILPNMLTSVMVLLGCVVYLRAFFNKEYHWIVGDKKGGKTATKKKEQKKEEPQEAARPTIELRDQAPSRSLPTRGASAPTVEDNTAQMQEPQQEHGVPPGWELCYTETNEAYYYNAKIDQSAWTIDDIYVMEQGM